MTDMKVKNSIATKISNNWSFHNKKSSGEGFGLETSEAVNMFSWIDRAGLYQDPPNHRIVK